MRPHGWDGWSATHETEYRLPMWRWNELSRCSRSCDSRPLLCHSYQSNSHHRWSPTHSESSKPILIDPYVSHPASDLHPVSSTAAAASRTRPLLLLYFVDCPAQHPPKKLAVPHLTRTLLYSPRYHPSSSFPRNLSPHRRNACSSSRLRTRPRLRNRF